MRKFVSIGVLTLLAVSAVVFFSACQSLPGASSTEKEINNEVSDMNNPVAKIEMENGDIIEIELLPKYAPNTVNNFITLAQKGFYDGVIFHRIVPGFVIQGGDPDGTGMGGPGYGIPGEFIENGFDANVLSHSRGVISMARSGHPDSAGSQFFIVVDDAAIPALDGKYAGFGIVLTGMDIVDEIVSAEAVDAGTGEVSSPVVPRVIKAVTIDTKGQEWPEPETVQ